MLKKRDIHNRDYFKYAPIILIVWGLFSIFFIPVIPIASGFGWDGIFHGEVALNFENLIGEISNYESGRIFPSILIHYFYKIFNITLNLKTVLFGFQIYYLVILTLSSFYWILIGTKLKLSNTANWIGFIALFINYPMLNLHFYNPALTDGTVFFMALLMIYIQQNKI
mgnify:CR=1 FL=1